MLKNNVQLQSYNSFHLLSIAECYLEFSKHEELIDILNKFETLPNITILGEGTNVVLPPIIKGLVFKSKNKTILNKEIINEYILIESGAGTNWDEFVSYAVREGACSIANLSYIPGTVGAAPVQNIGAYGKEAADFVDSVTCLDAETMNVIELSNRNCKFAYRWSIFKENKKYIILSVKFKFLRKETDTLGYLKKLNCFKLLLEYAFSAIYLKKSKRFIGLKFERIRDFLSLSCISEKFKRKLVIFVRKKTMIEPEKIGNVGCFFKAIIVNRTTLDRILDVNPNIHFFKAKNKLFKVSVGDLIKSSVDLRKNGDVFINPNRPLVVLNTSKNNNSIDILKFTDSIAKTVFEKYGVNIESEAVIL